MFGGQDPEESGVFVRHAWYSHSPDFDKPLPGYMAEFDDWFYQIVEGTGIDCTVAQYGDPLPAVDKMCEWIEAPRDVLGLTGAVNWTWYAAATHELHHASHLGIDALKPDQSVLRNRAADENGELDIFDEPTWLKYGKRARIPREHAHRGINTHNLSHRRWQKLVLPIGSGPCLLH